MPKPDPNKTLSDIIDDLRQSLDERGREAITGFLSLEEEILVSRDRDQLGDVPQAGRGPQGVRQAGGADACRASKLHQDLQEHSRRPRRPDRRAPPVVRHMRESLKPRPPGSGLPADAPACRREVMSLNRPSSATSDAVVRAEIQHRLSRVAPGPAVVLTDDTALNDLEIGLRPAQIRSTCSLDVARGESVRGPPRAQRHAHRGRFWTRCTGPPRSARRREMASTICSRAAGSGRKRGVVGGRDAHD